MNQSTFAESRELVLLYDGLCGFCDGTVQFVIAHDKKGTMKFAPLQGSYAEELLTRHPELAHVDSLILVRPANGTGNANTSMRATESVLVRSAAVIALGNYLGGAWRLWSALLWLMPSLLRDAAYNAFARRRFRLFGKRESCRIPSGKQRARFLE